MKNLTFHYLWQNFIKYSLWDNIKLLEKFLWFTGHFSVLFEPDDYKVFPLTIVMQLQHSKLQINAKFVDIRCQTLTDGLRIQLLRRHSNLCATKWQSLTRSSEAFHFARAFLIGVDFFFLSDFSTAQSNNIQRTHYGEN